jgi:uncharacterized protein
MNINWFDHLFFLVVGIILPSMSFVSEKSHDEDSNYKDLLPPKKHIYYTNGLILVIGALIVLTLWNVTYRSFDKLGFIAPYVDSIVLYLCVAISIIYLIDTLVNYFNTKKTKESIEELSHVMPTSWDDYIHFTFLAFAAGICEEIIFRGFLINYILEMSQGMTYSFYLALVLPAFIFAVSHIYQGWVSVLKIFTLSLLFGAIFLFSKSLILVIIIHVLVDLISGAVMVMVVEKK